MPRELKKPRIAIVAPVRLKKIMLDTRYGQAVHEGGAAACFARQWKKWESNEWEERARFCTHACVSLPGSGIPDGSSYQIKRDKEHAGPEHSAVSHSRGPQIVTVCGLRELLKIEHR
jgi:hypothetical protein